LDIAESSLALKDCIPRLVETTFLCLFFAWWLYVRRLVDTIELAALDGIRKSFVRSLDAFEE
jgi:hypothetical protein